MSPPLPPPKISRPWLVLSVEESLVGGNPVIIDPRVLREACGIVAGRCSSAALRDLEAWEYRVLIVNILHMMRSLGVQDIEGDMTRHEFQNRGCEDLAF